MVFMVITMISGNIYLSLEWNRLLYLLFPSFSTWTLIKLTHELNYSCKKTDTMNFIAHSGKMIKDEDCLSS